MSKIVDYKALDIHVLVVAVQRVEGAWCAYIKNVEGDDHASEAYVVKAWGSKLSERIALAIFPRFEGTPYAW